MPRKTRVDKPASEADTVGELIPGTKRVRTRARLIEAAAQVIGEKGYDRATLEEVAARAGMTRGAVYGNFRDKEELFLAVVESRWHPLAPKFVPGATLKQQMRALGEAAAEAAHARLNQAAAAAAFQLYALTNAHMRERMQTENARIYKDAARRLLKLVPQRQLPLPAAQFVRILDALVTGLLFTYFQTPDLISDEDFIAAFELMAD